MDVKEASNAVIELIKLEKSLEPTCSDCQNCKTLKMVKDEISNLSAFIIYEQAKKIFTLTRKIAGNDDPAVEKLFDKLEEAVLKNVGELPIKSPTNKSGNGGSNMN